MKVIPIISLNEFLSEFDKYCNSGNFYFRGQSVSKWEIKPGLARNKCLNSVSEINKAEIYLINSFQKIIYGNNLNNLLPFIQNSYHIYWQWLMFSQHYGLPTRLLDFTIDKYIALQFAIAEIEHLNDNGAILIYSNPSKIQEDVDSEILKNKHEPFQKTFFFQAPIYKKKSGNDLYLSENRKGIQGSKFLYVDNNCITKCISKDEFLSENIVKIIIPKEIKLPLIKHLIDIQKFAFDIYCGKNDIDYYTAMLKYKFHKIDMNNIGF